MRGESSGAASPARLPQSMILSLAPRMHKNPAIDYSGNGN
jgi:hypothetical protein